MSAQVRYPAGAYRVQYFPNVIDTEPFWGECLTLSFFLYKIYKYVKCIKSTQLHCLVHNRFCQGRGNIVCSYELQAVKCHKNVTDCGNFSPLLLLEIVSKKHVPHSLLVQSPLMWRLPFMSSALRTGKSLLSLRVHVTNYRK